MKDLFKKVLENSLGRIISLVVVLGIILLIVLLCINRKEELDVKYIMGKLEAASELTTAKLTYTGFAKYKDGGISIINRSDFLMVYEATARAGIDVKKIKIEQDKMNKIVWITIPEAEILDVKVNSNDITYYDEKFALFNFDSKEDSNKAIVLAEKDAKEKIGSMGILEMANTQAEALIKGLIQDSVPDNYEIKIR